jgi:hypothetical protein
MAKMMSCLRDRARSELHQLGRGPVLELRQVHDVFALLKLLERNYLEIPVVIGIFVVVRSSPPATVRLSARIL